MVEKEETQSKETDVPEKLRYSRYYEHDGVLRAYANRAMVLAFLCVRPRCWRSASQSMSACSLRRSSVWDENGQATVLGPQSLPSPVTQGAGSEPSEFEKRAFVR